MTTVSPSYAKEVLSAEGGQGLEATLLHYHHKFKGILNGVDYSYWNPEIDRFLPVHYSAHEISSPEKDHNFLSKKESLKKILRKN